MHYWPLRDASGAGSIGTYDRDDVREHRRDRTRSPAARAPASSLKGPETTRPNLTSGNEPGEAHLRWPCPSSTVPSGASRECSASTGWTRPPRTPRSWCSAINWPCCACACRPGTAVRAPRPHPPTLDLPTPPVRSTHGRARHRRHRRLVHEYRLVARAGGMGFSAPTGLTQHESPRDRGISAVLLLFRGGGGSGTSGDRRVTDPTNVLASRSLICSCIRTRLLSFGGLGDQSRETRPCLPGRSAEVVEVVALEQVVHGPGIVLVDDPVGDELPE